MHEDCKEWPGESEERLRAFIEHAPRKMWISRTDGTVEFFNRKWRAYTGQAVDNGTRTWREAVHPDDRATLEETRDRAVARVETYDVQVRLRRASDGAYRWHIGRVAPVHLHGTLIAWIGVATDIDGRIRAEAALRESEANFRTLADAIPQVVWMRDPQAQRAWFNRRWFAFTGMAPDQVQEDGWWAAIHPDHLDAMTDVVHEARTRGERWEFTAPFRRADGTYRWFLFRGVPIRDEAKGTVTRWFGTGTDIHEQQETQERQRLMTQEVSHRVKNSLALVAGQLSLQARAAEDGAARRVLMDAYSRVQTIAGVHDHLWRQYDARFTELSSFLSDLCRKLQETAPDHEVTFTGSPVVVPTDQAVPIGLVVNELVTNALKHAYPEGAGGPIRVELRGGGDGSLALQVIDRGLGVPEGFDFCAPTKSLGMRLLVNTIRQLNATATVTAAEPGTCFEIRIPASTR
jgi:PAS domain S-box-containing protein